MRLAHALAQLRDGGLDTGVDPRQRGIVRGRPGIVDDRVDVSARVRGLLLDPAVGFLELFQPSSVRLLIRSFLHLHHDHPPQRDRPLQRTDIGPRQIAIGRDVAIGQLVQENADLARHHHRQDRGDQHQDDQSEGDADNLAPDRLVEKRHEVRAKAEMRGLRNSIHRISAREHAQSRHSRRQEPPATVARGPFVNKG